MTSTYRTVPDWREAMRVDWPAGQHGEATLSRFTVSEQDSKFTRLQAVFSGGGRGTVPSGTYTSLKIRGALWMSDTPDEMRDHFSCLSDVHRFDASRVLVNGLGLGMVIRALCIFPSVETIDVVELHPDVIALVGPHVREFAAQHGKTVNIVEGDAHEPSKLFAKGARWDVVWHDIWLEICADNWESMKTLKRRYAKRCSSQGVWCEWETRRAVRQAKAYNW